MQEIDSKEKEILKFWKDEKVYEKSREKNANGKKFYFMDGPPYATGHIHMGTALNKILKDIAMRSRRLQGYNVFDRPGYDTHGLPIEFQVEKDIGSKSKQDIEKYGVSEFVEKCKDYATKYIDVMNSEFENLGVWMSWDKPYLSLDAEYIEAVWDVLKTASEKDLLYLGKYPVHLCPRCETAVAYNEIEYGKQEDTSVFVKFPLKVEDKENTFLIIWTTTPWTLPANTGVMVHPDLIYQEVETSEGEKWIIAKDLVQNLMALLERGFTIKKEYRGHEMKNWRYENPLSKNLKLNLSENGQNAYRVVLSGRYVTTEQGSGLVHCAPGHGKEDYEVGKENELDAPCPVGLNGKLTEEAGKYAGKKAREVDAEIINDLEESGFLIYKHKYGHDYPFCWRCKSALLMVSQPQWFLKISGIHQQLLEENEKTHWVPDWMKLRMKAWLEGIGDWPISRERYWGTPLPIWTCQNTECEEKRVIGNIKELETLYGKSIGDLHKPEIDEVTFECETCKTKMKRISSVLDVWFDSGVSSWAALGYPSKNEEFDKFWPADLNIEGNDQFRGWWNSQLILSVIRFGKRPFESIAVHGMVTDVEKKKMSKSTGNIVSPQEVIEKYGRDYLRYYFAKLSKGEDFSYDEKEFSEIGNAFRVLANVNRFVNQLEKSSKGEEIEDSWIISRFNNTIKEVTESLNRYRFYEAVNRLEKFLVEDLSRTYIQLIRERSNEVYEILNEIRLGLIKMFAPLMPFKTEEIWQDLKVKKIVEQESVHLSDWPKVDEAKTNQKLESEFNTVLRIIERGLSARDKEKVGLRWPLAKAVVSINSEEHKINEELRKIIMRQLNVKNVGFVQGEELEVKLDLKMTEELKAEGFAREIARKVQSERKKKGLEKSDFIELKLAVGSELKHMLEKHFEFLKNRTGSKSIFIDDKNKKLGISFKIREEEISVDF